MMQPRKKKQIHGFSNRNSNNISLEVRLARLRQNVKVTDIMFKKRFDGNATSFHENKSHIYRNFLAASKKPATPSSSEFWINTWLKDKQTAEKQLVDVCESMKETEKVCSLVRDSMFSFLIVLS